MNCKVTIITKSDCFESKMQTFGTLEEKANLFTLNYTVDGDGCVLTYDGSTVTQTRRGGQNINMTFIEGKKTFCTLGEGDFKGEFMLFCKSVKFTKDKGGIKLSLEYDCGGGDTSLRLTADFEQEKK